MRTAIWSGSVAGLTSRTSRTAPSSLTRKSAAVEAGDRRALAVDDRDVDLAGAGARALRRAAPAAPAEAISADSGECANSWSHSRKYRCPRQRNVKPSHADK